MAVLYYDDSTSTNGAVWYYWCESATSTSTASTWATSTATTAWRVWCNSTTASNAIVYTSNPVKVQAKTQAELEAESAEVKRRQEEYAKQLEIERKKREAAEVRAKELLLSLLSAEQRIEFLKKKLFTVEARDGRRYRIKKGWAGNVEEIGANGKPVNRLCIHLSDPKLPEHDNMIAQKMLLDADPEMFRRTANLTPVG